MAGMEGEAGEGQEGAERARTVHGNEQGGLQVTSETPGTKSPRSVQRRTSAAGRPSHGKQPTVTMRLGSCGGLRAGGQRDRTWVPAPGGTGNRRGQNLLGLCIQISESVETKNHSFIH